MTKRFGRKMLKPLKKGSALTSRKRGGGGGGASSCASLSVVSDNETVGGQQSVAARTVDSQTTIKVSNKNHSNSHNNHNNTSSSLPQSSTSAAAQQRKESSKPWKSFKRFVGAGGGGGGGGKKNPPGLSSREAVSNKNSNGGGGGGGGLKRILNVNAAAIFHHNPTVTACPATSSSSSRHAYELDKAIRGRLDGIDTLSLGPACRPLCLSSDNKKKKKKTTEISKAAGGGEKTPQNSKAGDSADLLRNVDPLTISFTGSSDDGYLPKDSVFDMLWTSEGKEHSELIFEGYVPGGSDRWTVKLEDNQHLKEEEIPSSSSTTVLASSSTIATGEIPEDGFLSNTRLSKPISIDEFCGGGEDDVLSHDESTAVSTAVMSDEDGSPIIPIHQLWEHMWGGDSPPPLPTHMQAGGDAGDKDEVLQLAAACSVPIDLDDDTFIIESREHLRAIHDLTMVPIQGRRFESAMMIFKNILSGFEGSSLGSKMEHLVGVTYHNIGILYLCLGNFDDALQNFDKAVTARIECLPRNHPDIAVSLAKQGTAQFALGSFEQALNSFNMALDIFPNDDTTRAKLLNSIGVVLAFQGKHTEAMKIFTYSLEIQRVWLESPVRRDSLVYDASITLENMGKLYLRAGDDDLSYFVYEEACVLLTTAFRRDHDIVFICLENMARLLAKRGEYLQALEVLTSMHEAQDQRFGIDNNVMGIETLGLLGYIQSKLFDFGDALTKFEAVSNWQTKKLPASHPSAQVVTESMDKLKVYQDEIVQSSPMSC